MRKSAPVDEPPLAEPWWLSDRRTLFDQPAQAPPEAILEKGPEALNYCAVSHPAGSRLARLLGWRETIIAMTMEDGARIVVVEGRFPWWPFWPLSKSDCLITETYDSWTVRCNSAAAADGTVRQCQISVEVLQVQTKQRILTLLFRPTAKAGSLEGTILAPFEVKRSEGITLKAGNKDFKKIALLTCWPNGWLATADFNGDEIKMLGSQEKLVASVVSFNGGNPLDFEIPMKGFSAALAQLGTLSSKSASTR